MSSKENKITAGESRPVVSLVGMGAMGAGLGGVLCRQGLVVQVNAEGRSPASRERAMKAGLTQVDTTHFLDADIILSIVPPAQAARVARHMANCWGAHESKNGRKPIFVDCNALSPESSKQQEQVLSEVQMPYVDGGIIGLPPTDGARNPKLFVSGKEAANIAALIPFGLDVRVMDGPVGAASALKLCYGGITKGLIALATSSILAAERAGIVQDLVDELADSQNALYQGLLRSVPDMLPKAYRWIAEMEEITAFLDTNRPESEIYRQIGALYDHIAKQHDGYKKPNFEHFLRTQPTSRAKT